MHPRQRKQRRKSPLRWLVLLPVVLLLAALHIGARYYFRELPYREAESHMPDNPELTLRQQEGGSLRLAWQPSQDADLYCIEILRPGKEAQAEPEIIFRGYTQDPDSYPLPGLPPETELTIRVSSVVEYGKGERLCENPAQATLSFAAPAVTNLTWEADWETGTLDLSWQLQNATHCRIWLAEEGKAPVLLRSVTDNALSLSLGAEDALPPLNRGDSYQLLFDACLMSGDVTFYGLQSGSLAVTGEDFLGRELNAVLTDRGNNRCTITWEETKGEYYEVQLLDAARQQWIPVATVPADGERSYTTGHLKNLSAYRFRVLAMGGDTLPGMAYAAISDELEYKTDVTPLCCTVWPIKDMTAYDAPEGGKAAGQVTQGKAYCVVAVEGDRFGISLNGETRYIDSNYCMINLPEYLGQLCAYDITNSYSSLYMVHEYALPGITDTVIDGYGDIKQADGSYLVPLLYPTAKKLLTAAQDAHSRGYRLKIYDAFRPRQATVQIYEGAQALLDSPIPDQPFRGSTPEDMPVVPPGAAITYRKLMTTGGWALNNFLAPGRSTHNFGIAVDLTLEALDTGEALKMQSVIHDLSGYSVVLKNTETANILAEIMKSTGMEGLISEWWHFQDAAARERLDPPALWQGVSAECWMWDGIGWRYRTQDGSYLKDSTQTIDTITYRFDSEGYAYATE